MRLCELLGETIRNMFGVVLILLLNVMEVFSVIGSALLDIPCIVFQSVCVCCACDPSVRLDATSHMFCLSMSELISFRITVCLFVGFVPYM